MKVRIQCFWSLTVILGFDEDVVEGVYQMPSFEIESEVEEREVEEHEVEEHEVEEDFRVFPWGHVRLFANQISFQPDPHLFYTSP
jgi:hypothetical protein